MNLIITIIITNFVTALVWYNFGKSKSRRLSGKEKAHIVSVVFNDAFEYIYEKYHKGENKEAVKHDYNMGMLRKQLEDIGKMLKN